jgi:hypothetical protein
MRDNRITQERVLALASQAAGLLEDYRYAQGTETSLYERMASVGLHGGDDVRRGVHRQMLVDGIYPSPIDTSDVLQECLQTLGDLCPAVVDMVRDVHLDLYGELWPADKERRESAPARRVRKDTFFRRLRNAAGNVVIIRREEAKGAAQPTESLFAGRESCAQKFIEAYGPDSGRYGGLQVMLLEAPGETYRVTYNFGAVAIFDVIILEGAGRRESGGTR